MENLDAGDTQTERQRDHGMSGFMVCDTEPAIGHLRSKPRYRLRAAKMAAQNTRLIIIESLSSGGRDYSAIIARDEQVSSKCIEIIQAVGGRKLHLFIRSSPDRRHRRFAVPCRVTMNFSGGGRSSRDNVKLSGACYGLFCRAVRCGDLDDIFRRVMRSAQERSGRLPSPKRGPVAD